MGVRILADTNCVSDFLNGRLSSTAIDFIINASVELSVINRMELLSWSAATKEQMDVIKGFAEICTVHPLDEETIIVAINIRRTLKLKLPDAIIGATALVKSLVLVTHNRKDFQNIKGLKLIDQHSI